MVNGRRADDAAFHLEKAINESMAERPDFAEQKKRWKIIRLAIEELIAVEFIEEARHSEDL